VTAAAIGLALFAALILLPVVTRGSGGVWPRAAAGAYLISLLGWGFLPAVWLACLGGSVGSWLAGTKVSGGGCLLGLEQGQWRLLAYLPGACALGLVVCHAARLAIRARRVELRGLALAGSDRRQVRGGATVWVVPADRPAAYAGGLWRSRAVVTSGLLAPLDEPERQAVCEHEAAHVRLGHPRLLVAGGAVAAAYGWLPPVRRAWDGLRRELEAAADDEAVRAVGSATVISALVRVALSAGGITMGGVAGFGEAEHLRWRIARLEDGSPVRAVSTAVVVSAAAAVGSMLAWSACVLSGVPATTTGLAICLAVVVALASRPVWGWMGVAGRLAHQPVSVSIPTERSSAAPYHGGATDSSLGGALRAAAPRTGRAVTSEPYQKESRRDE
jgi:hypothetical protein